MTLYCPTLRLKEGEVIAVRELTSDVFGHLLPILIAASPAEHDPLKGRVLSDDELVHVNASRVARMWSDRPCLIDLRFLPERLGRDGGVDWIPAFFAGARRHGATGAGPLVTLSDGSGGMLLGYRRAIEAADAEVGIRLTSADLQRGDTGDNVRRLLRSLGRAPEAVTIVMDFGGANITLVDVAADVMLASYEQVSAWAHWKNIIVLSTSFPEKNPAPKHGFAQLPRTEEQIWNRLWTSGAMDPERAVFGDFGPDSSKFLFSGGGIQPIPHFRYSTPELWLVPRGSSDDPRAASVREIARKLVEHPLFMGEDYSYGDRYILDCAEGRQVGGAQQWRTANVNHHLQDQTRRLAQSVGLSIMQLVRRPLERQLSLLSS